MQNFTFVIHLRKRLNISLIFFLGLIAFGSLTAKAAYKPSIGDKFVYKILLRDGKRFPASFIYNEKEKVPAFSWKWGSENPIWGSWQESKISTTNIAINFVETSVLANSNLVYLNQPLFSKIKSHKNFTLIIQGENVEFKCGESRIYNLPIEDANVKCKLLTASSNDGKWIISVLDNEDFPLIVGLLGDISWQLQSIVPAPMFPITQNLIGVKFDSKQADMFKTYIKETCETIEFKYTENFKKVVFNEYFCPIAGIRFSVRNDTIVSLQLVSDNYNRDGYNWQTYHGYVWGIFRLGDKKTTIETEYGKPVSSSSSKNYYPYKRFYLMYNSSGELERVEYE